VQFEVQAPARLRIKEVTSGKEPQSIAKYAVASGVIAAIPVIKCERSQQYLPCH
jgi:hypothetical protein